LAGLDEREAGHEHGQQSKKAVANHGFDGERVRGGEAAAVDVHVQEVGTGNQGQESQHEKSYQRSPDTQPPANQQKQAEQDFGEGQGVRDKRDRKSTRLNSSHGYISYAVFCLNTKTATSVVSRP